MAKIMVVGMQGSGKSTVAIYLARKIALISKDIIIYTNMNVDNNSQLKTIRDLSEVPFDRSPKILLVDEAMSTLDSRSHSSQQNKIWTKAQAFFRKSNFLLVAYMTHTIDLIDVRMRKQLDYVIMCRKNKTKFDYMMFDLISQQKRPFSLPKTKEIFDFTKFDTYDFPPPILIDGLKDDVLYKILK